MKIYSLFTSTSAVLVAAVSVPATDVEVLPSVNGLDGPIRIKDLVKRNMLVPIEQRSDILERRAFNNKTLDLSWQRQSQTLFSASWEGSTPRLPVAPLPVPITQSIGGAFSLTLQCADCKTYGNIIASLDDSFTDGDGIEAQLVFNKVGAYMDLSLFASGEGTYTIGLGTAFGPPGNVTGKVLSAFFGVSMDLILQVTGQVQATGGFQVSIPDGEKVNMELDFDFNLLKQDKFNATSKIRAAPRVNFSLLPITVSDSSVNMTAALRLKVDVGMGGTFGPADTPGAVTLAAQAGAHMTFVQVKLGTSSSATCKNALFIDVDSEAGAFAQAAAQVGTRGFDFAPAASTTFFAAGTTTCLGDTKPTPRFISTKPPTLGAGTVGCPTSLKTETTTVTSVYSLTTCAVPAIDCPSKFTQVIVATNVETVNTVRCPVNVTAAQGLAAATMSVTPVAPTGNPVNLTSLAVPRVAAAPTFGNFTIPANASRITGAFVAVTPPPDGKRDDKKNAAVGVYVPGIWMTGSRLLSVLLVMACL